MNFNIQIDSVPYKQKPGRADVQKLKPRLAAEDPQSVDIIRFKELVLSGHSYTPGILQGGSKAENWAAQQLFCLDIDNEDKTTAKGEDKRRAAEPVTVDEVLRRCSEWSIKPALIYETFSSCPEWQKFRIVFVADHVITDGEKRDGIQLALMELFPECDGACKNRDRLFYGGKSVLYIDESAVFAPESIASINTALQSRKTFEKSEMKSSKSFGQLDELKRDFDFLGYIRSFGGKERRAGRLIGFNPCPVCGHRDDFFYYPETKTFNCFGKSGDVGGTVIDFLMHTRNISRREAVEAFKYELCGLSRSEDKAAFRKERMLQSASETGVDVSSGEFPPYIFEKVNERTGEVKYYVCCPLLAEYIREHSHYMFVKNEAFDGVRRYWYTNGYYKLITDDELKGYIKAYITAFDPTLLKMRDVSEVFNDLITDRKFVSESRLNNDENIINFQNGLLCLDTLELKPHSPDILSTIQIPCNWNPNCMIYGSSPVFDSFLNTFTEGREDKKAFLLQYMGACLSNIKGYRMKKALFMVGAGDTGKTQLKTLTERLLGEQNISPADLSDLERRFGTSRIYGKRLAGSSDMSYATVTELKLFKQITGGDEISIEKKCKDAFNYKYNGFLWFCTNELPRFGGDRGKWVYERIIPFRCSHVIPKEEQDKLLCDKMFAEREAIVYRAVMAVRKVIDNGYRFDIPVECLIDLQEYEKVNSPAIQFFEECCTLRHNSEIRDSCTTRKVHDAFREWCRDNTGGYVPKLPLFKREVSQYIGIDENAIIKTVRGTRYYIFTLSSEAKETYHIYDSLPSA